MDKALKAKWVKALRSRRYRQGQNTLQTDDGANCCLGVLCRVSRAKIDIHNWNTLPNSLCRKLGLTSAQEASLIRLNDGTIANGHKATPFPAIADWIEKHL